MGAVGLLLEELRGLLHLELVEGAFGESLTRCALAFIVLVSKWLLEVVGVYDVGGGVRLLADQLDPGLNLAFRVVRLLRLSRCRLRSYFGGLCKHLLFEERLLLS